ncbi:hypothetical protein BC832DRAFT_617647 [Gaertneriomyces semiglobifer]|nr:hypothetical protein BC832DRAFT_617647 [Gaertneriomyces semiglobifer]
MIFDPDHAAKHVAEVLAVKIPNVDWRVHATPVVVAARLMATAHGLGGAVVAYDVQLRQSRTPRNTRHWADHARAPEWCRTNMKARGPVGKPSAFFQSSPWQQSASQGVHPVSGLNAVGVAQSIHQEICNRLLANNVDVSEVNPALTAFLHPANDTSDQVLDCLMDLKRNHMKVSDADMVRALGLRESKEGDLEGNDSSDTFYYVRSWALTVEDLRAIITQWADQEAEIDEAWLWLGHVLLAPKDSICYIRYVGMCDAPTTPYERFMVDMKQRENGLLNDFLTALQQVCPDSYASGKTYEFVRGRVPAFASDKIKDDRERIIIAFFGLDSLLNRQPGGKFASYVPDIGDCTLFQKLGTRFFQHFGMHAVPCSNGMKASLKSEWIPRIEEITMENPIETGVSLNMLTPKTLEMIAAQATPRLVNGHVILVVIGKDITREDFLGARTFLSGLSRAGHLTADFLARLEAYERDVQEWDATLLPKAPFPFVDLFPWLSTQAIEGALEQLALYLRTVRPLICVTQSQKVTSCAAANFYHPHGLPLTGGYLSAVGTPQLHHYADEGWLEDDAQTQPPAGFATIVIPHFDPGRDKYGAQAKQLRRVLDITWMITLYVGDKMIIAAASHANWDRDRLCRTVLEEVEQDPQYKELSATLEQAKENLKAYWELIRRRWVAADGEGTRVCSELTQERLREAAKERMERGLAAEGLPRSEERQAQVNYLWKLQIPDLLIPTYDETTWKEWALTRGQECFTLQRRCKQLHPLRNILRAFAPEGATDDSWMWDDQLRTMALQQKTSQMKAALPADHFSSDKQRERRRKFLAAGGLAAPPHRKKRGTFHADWEGREVKIGSGQFTIFWHDEERGEDITIPLRVASTCSNVCPTDKRFIHFVEGGISLRDESGTLLTISRGTETVLIQRALFYMLAKGDAMERLWQKERRQIAPEATTSAPEATTTAGPSTTTSLPKGRDAWRNTTQPHVKAAFQFPIQQGDALWLLQQWLDSDYPQGGTFNSADPDHLPSIASDSIQRRFRVVLDQHRDHPYYPLWSTWLNAFAKYGKNIFANIRFLREVPSEKKRRVLSQRNVYHRYVEMTIGPVRSL